VGHPTQGSSLNHQLLGRVRIVETFDPETHRKVPLRVLGIVSVTGVLLQDFVHHEPIQVPSIVGSQPIAPHRSVDVGEQFELLSSTHHGVNHPGQQVPIQSIQGWRALQRLLELPGHHQLLGFEPGTCMSFTFDPCHVHPRYEPDSSPQEWTHSHRGGFNLHICRPPIRNKHPLPPPKHFDPPRPNNPEKLFEVVSTHTYAVPLSAISNTTPNSCQSHKRFMVEVVEEKRRFMNDPTHLGFNRSNRGQSGTDTPPPIP
jgi:hypothetical protein